MGGESPTGQRSPVDLVRKLIDVHELPMDDAALEDLAQLYAFYQDGIRQIRLLLRDEDAPYVPRPARAIEAARCGIGSRSDSTLAAIAAWAEIDPYGALESARALQSSLLGDPPPINGFINACPLPAKPPAGPLSGVVYAVKDNIEVNGALRTFGSRALPLEKSSADAPIIAALRRSGALCVAKANMGQFALSVNTSDFGEVCNPWSLDRNPGGSSSGSAAAVASGHVDFSIGTDAGGSVRVPAALCGIVGFRPTGGSLDLRGIGGTPWSVDNFGFMARTAPDVQQVMSALEWNVDPDAVGGRALRIGVLLDDSMGMIDPHVRAVYEGAASKLQELGCNVDEVSLPGHAIAPYVVGLIAYAEVGAQHRELIRAKPEAYHPDVRRLVRFGQLIGPGEYADAARAQFVLRERYRRVTEGLDGIALPTMPTTAPRRGEEPHVPGDDPLSAVFGFMRFTGLFNLTAHPTITLTAGLAPDGLPVGIQLVGRHHRDVELLDLAARLEQIIGPSPTPPYSVDLRDYGRALG